jgi:hypothetical protein
MPGKPMTVLRYALLIGLFAGPSLSLAQSTADKSQLKVYVRPVIAFDNPEQAVFKQRLFRELRKIPEVIVVEGEKQRADTELYVTIVRTENTAGYKTGYVAAVAEFDPLDVSQLEPLPPSDAPLVALLSNVGFLVNVAVTRDTSITSLCRSIVAHWETDIVEPRRQSDQQRK